MRRWITFILLAGVVLAGAGAACTGEHGDDGDDAAVTATNTPKLAPTDAAAPTATLVAQNRQDCAAIRGTAYLGVEEQEWYLANCSVSQSQPQQQPQEPEAGPRLQQAEAQALAMNWLVDRGASWPSSSILVIPRGLWASTQGYGLEYFLSVDQCTGSWASGQWTIACPVEFDNVFRGDGRPLRRTDIMFLNVFETTLTVAFAQ